MKGLSHFPLRNFEKISLSNLLSGYTTISKSNYSLNSPFRGSLQEEFQRQQLHVEDRTESYSVENWWADFRSLFASVALLPVSRR